MEYSRGGAEKFHRKDNEEHEELLRAKRTFSPSWLKNNSAAPHCVPLPLSQACRSLGIHAM
jgi:hypothetical protein